MADITRLAIITIMIMLQFACNDQEPAEATTNNDGFAPVKPVPKELLQGMSEGEPQVGFLTVADPTPPETWLNEIQITMNGQDPYTPGYYKKLLNNIYPHVHESRRMIANRSVQTSRSLNEKGVEMSTETLLETFSSQLQQSRQKIVYGELCAQYTTLRLQGSSHDNAVNTLFN